MADVFIEVPFETDSQTMADDAVDRLRDRWEGWEPNDGDPEVVQIETLAPMAQNAVETAAKVPPAAFTTILEKLHGVPYLVGSPASTTVTLVLADANGHSVPAHARFEIDGYEFATIVDVDVPAGEDTVTGVTVVCSTVGVAANDLTGTTTAPISALSFLDDIIVEAPTREGVDPEDQQAYRNRGSRELELQAKTLVTERDYELFGLSEQGVGRIIAQSDVATRTMRVTATDIDGQTLTQLVKDDLAARYDGYRLTNWLLTVGDATYTTIGVTYAVKPYPGYDPVDLQARVDAALADALSSATWGKPRVGDASATNRLWLSETVVRRNKLIDLIGNVDGVDYVDTLTLNGSAGSAATNGDWNLPGAVPLTVPGAMNGTVLP